MPFRIYQGKEVLTDEPLVLPRGQIFVDLNTLQVHVGDGFTPGGVPVGPDAGGTVSPTDIDGGGAAAIYTPNEILDGGGA